MFSLYFSLGMLIWLIIHLIMKLFYCKKCDKNKVFLRQKLFEKMDLLYIYHNSDILEYALLEAEKLANSIYRDIIATRDRALSIVNYLFLGVGGLFFIFFYKNDTLPQLNLNIGILLLCGYITTVILFLAINFIVPSANKTKTLYLDPVFSIPAKNNPKDLIEIKIEKLLGMQQTIEENAKFSKQLRNKLFLSVLEITCFILSLLLYFLSFLL